MIKVFEAFAGIGTQRMALKKQGIKHEVTAISEVDEYALLSYHVIHTAGIEVKEASEEEMQIYMEKKNIPLDPKGKRKILKNKRLKDLYVASVASNNLGDISKITDDEIPRVDLFTYSFPCQDISLAGQQRGLDRNSGTRSSLLWECEKIIETVKPKYLLMENVKALINKKNKPQFDVWLEYLEELGYKNFWQILNAKDYGVPQNRERVFVVSILDEDADYHFPKPIKLEKRLKDVLEDEVDEKYYLSKKIQDRLTVKLNMNNEIKTIGSTKGKDNTRLGQRDIVYSDEGIMGALNATDYKQPKQILDAEIKQIAQYDSPTRKNTNQYRAYDPNGLSPTLNTMGGGGRQPHIPEPSFVTGIPIKNATEQGYLLGKNGDGVDLAYPTSNTRRGRVQKNVYQTLTTDDSKGVVEQCRIRKLTPNECWRLMGVEDEDFEKANKVVSNSKLYEQAGNAIVVDVLEGIFEQLFNPDENNLESNER